MMLTITIRPQGFMANQMIEYMFAWTVQTLIKRPSRIIKYDHVLFEQSDPGWKEDLQNWDISFPAEPLPAGKTFWLRGNDVNLGKLVKQIDQGEIDNLIVCGPLLNLRYFYSPSEYRHLFTCPARDLNFIYTCADDEILIHIRAGDVVEGAHRDYFPLPFSYYRALLEKTGLKPVFMGQIGKDVYSAELKKAFPDAKFLERQTVVADFETVRRAKNVITSISSFAWLSTWLSENLQKVYMPVGGFLNPNQRNDIDLIVRDDPRYNYYMFDQWKFGAGKEDFELLFSDKMSFRSVPVSEIPFFNGRIHRGIHNKFGVHLPLKFSQTRHRLLSAKQPHRSLQNRTIGN